MHKSTAAEEERELEARQISSSSSCAQFAVEAELIELTYVSLPKVNAVLLSIRQPRLIRSSDILWGQSMDDDEWRAVHENLLPQFSQTNNA